MKNIKITIENTDPQHEWSVAQFEEIINTCNELADRLHIQREEILVTGFRVVATPKPYLNECNIIEP